MGADAADDMLMVPAPFTIVIPAPWVNVANVYPVPLPIKSWPLVGVPDTFVPPLATGSVPVTPVESGSPVQDVSVPPEGAPSAPPFTTNAPAVPTATPRAVTTPVPVVIVEGAAPVPPPIIRALAVSNAELAIVVVALNHGIPP